MAHRGLDDSKFKLSHRTGPPGCLCETYQFGVLPKWHFSHISKSLRRSKWLEPEAVSEFDFAFLDSVLLLLTRAVKSWRKLIVNNRHEPTVSVVLYCVSAQHMPGGIVGRQRRLTPLAAE